LIQSSHHFSHSYEAAEGNELTFAEGDHITQIEAVSDDWWQGRDQHGNAGLFPGKLNALQFISIDLNECYAPAANYVEVLE
jgi:hypothetical protein